MNISMYLIKKTYFQVLRSARDICEKAFLVLPQYCFGGGLLDMSLIYVERQTLSKFGLAVNESLWTWERCGGKIICMILQG